LNCIFVAFLIAELVRIYQRIQFAMYVYGCGVDCPGKHVKTLVHSRQAAPQPSAGAARHREGERCKRYPGDVGHHAAAAAGAAFTVWATCTATALAVLAAASACL
jgi:hypothetical protein